ncbi:hypothetical protein A28LD_1919 [Idiomarina sp. A28L]|uniref:hypothetical protein n=1 Tax=Idiomarina sp. A28L TaxID=1036674 RepID=UPI00021388C4|nr:hypothetical protein [Idiomarina sp. A28L]EGN74902.1 hypothetical protein A28LD_1919 [Idiomarina sp. A28L]
MADKQHQPKDPKLPIKMVSSSAASTSSNLGVALAISIASLIVVAVLMRSASLQMWSDHTGGWRDAEFDAAASRFQTHVMLAHVEWIRQSQPADVVLEVRGDTYTIVPMGKNGWPVGENGETTGNELCRSVWELLAEPGDMRKDLRTEWAVEGNRGFCKFYYDNILRFRYQPSNGQIYHEPKPA